MTRNVRRYHRVFREANGDGPWVCGLCDEAVLTVGRAAYDGQVHHLDGDYTNDCCTNLIITHNRCHACHHTTGRPKTRAHAEKVNAANRGRTRTLAQRLRMSAGHTYATCEACGYTSTKEWVTRHDCPRR